jgi:hypothetical protein
MATMPEDDQISTAFSGLTGKGKAIFLARVAHMETIRVRDLYHRSPPDPAAMFQSSELIHRLCGYAMQVLTRDTEQDQDRSVVRMILAAVEPRGAPSTAELLDWIQQARGPVA